jgi:Cytochrome P450
MSICSLSISSMGISCARIGPNELTFSIQVSRTPTPSDQDMNFLLRAEVIIRCHPMTPIMLSRLTSKLLILSIVGCWAMQALKEQEPILQKYVDLFIARLREQAPKGTIDIKSFFNFIIFDITGDLMFGGSFGCLEDGKLHPWIELLFGTAKAYSYIMAVNRFPWVKSALTHMIPKKVIQEGIDHFDLTAKKVDKRLEMKTDRPDIISFAFRNA